MRRTSGFVPRELVAAVAPSGAARVEPWCKHDDHRCGWCCWDCRWWRCQWVGEVRRYWHYHVSVVRKEKGERRKEEGGKRKRESIIIHNLSQCFGQKRTTSSETTTTTKSWRRTSDRWDSKKTDNVNERRNQATPEEEE